MRFDTRRFLLFPAFLFLSVSAQQHQQQQQQQHPPRPTPQPSLSSYTALALVTTVSHSGHHDIPVTTILPVVHTITIPPTPTPSPSPTHTSSGTANNAIVTPQAAILDDTTNNNNSTNNTTATNNTTVSLSTHIDGAFGTLGAILILTGIPNAFLGHKNRWSSFFIIGFYTMSLVCFVLILKYGILQAVNPPDTTLRGLFVLSCGVAGIAGGGVAIFFWKASKYFIGAWGGFAFALWIQCFRDGGLIDPIGLRWIMYIGKSRDCMLPATALPG